MQRNTEGLYAAHCYRISLIFVTILVFFAKRVDDEIFTYTLNQSETEFSIIQIMQNETTWQDDIYEEITQKFIEELL